MERQKRFFDLGLRSLDLMKVHALIQRDVEPSVTLIDLFNYPSIESLSAHLESSTSAGHWRGDFPRQGTGRQTQSSACPGTHKSEADATAQSQRGSIMAGYDTDDLPVGAIAIIGMSGRFPGAKTVRQTLE